MGYDVEGSLIIMQRCSKGYFITLLGACSLLIGSFIGLAVAVASYADSPNESIPVDVVRVFHDEAVDATQFIGGQDGNAVRTYNDAPETDLRYMQPYFTIISDDNGGNNHLVGDRWIAAVYINGKPAGFTSVIRNSETNEIEPYMTAAYKPVAEYLETTYRQGGNFAELEMSPLGYFMFKDGKVTPLGESSTAYISASVSEQEFFDTLDRIIMKASADAKADPLAAGGGGPAADVTTINIMERQSGVSSESALAVVLTCLAIGVVPAVVLLWKKRHDVTGVG
ncbi:hypothetical protein JS533_000880 [Bifidobacterium amazonense]|uniref:ABC transporter permease n=1 Tax=Bifidobacterium amazonense TaxID=2809027 RepID=A0ABS9VRX9_9BIFI|nr:hypothetical protein [Bifidobacterium amazonense]MCH9274845.1 hypothetical protein [Bifidobacterium amazonense]